MDKSIIIALWNANGLAAHHQEVELFLKIHKIDIFLISETHFTERSFFKIHNYNVYHTQHPDGTAHGGTAVIINKKIAHFEMEKYEKDHIQSTAVGIRDLNGTIVVAAVYCPPKHSITKDRFLNYFATLGNRFIIGGDYNAKHLQWGSRLITTRGRELQKAITTNNCWHLSTGEPTYWPTDVNKIPDLLDFFITKGLSNHYTDIKSILDLSSDHSPVIATVSTTIIKTEKKPYLYNGNTDWDMFRRYLLASGSMKLPLKSEVDIEHATEQLIRTIQEAALQATPPPKEGNHAVTNYPQEIRIKIAEKRNARKTWQQSRLPADKTRLNRLNKQLKNMLYKIKNETFQDYISNLSPYPTEGYSLWKATRKMKRPCQSIPPIRKNDGTWARNNSSKAKVFAEHLYTVFQPNASTNNDEEKAITDYLDSPLQMSLPIKYFTPGEVREEIKFLNDKKSPGYDLITAKVLKELPKKTTVIVTEIFNAVLRIQYFPIQWKFGQIILIQKPGKPPTEKTSYRPITLLPCLSKLLEKLLLKRIKPVLENSDIIPQHQFGFRESHSTLEQVHRVVDVIENDFEEKRVCSAVFLDVQQAFDRVWHNGLLYKIKQTLPHQYYLLFKSYLSERFFQVKVENDLSEYHLVQAGVPQGSVLGPTLYLIYTADIPFSENVILATFADDTALLSSHQNPTEASTQLQTSLNILETWLRKWRIKVNEEKSVHITFTLRHTTSPDVILNGKVIPNKDTVRYLGIHLDKRLTWRDHITKKRKELDIKIKTMYWLLGFKSNLSLNSKLLLYKTAIVPIWTYGIMLWGCAKKSNVNIIQRFQSKVLRLMTKAPWYVSNMTLHNDLHIKWVQEEIKTYTERYVTRLNTHPNTLAVNLLNNEHVNRRLTRTKVLDRA